MALDQETPIYVNVKLEQSDVFMNKMSSSEQFEEIEDDDKLQLLSYLINNPSTSDKKKAKCLHQRIIINYENKNWLNVVDDIKMFEEINNSGVFSVLKIKARLHEHCRKARLSIMKMMNNGNYCDEHEKLFYNISQKNIDDLINGEMPIRCRSAKKSIKRLTK
ncbi:unnamed protein product [Rotaria sordida]|uniref:Uncharacterized protein n=2 Tax=Rotaria sordida TaxID=392033 RepID=A0A815P6Z0_9BILA|nr:unnamed protein product [Rotaria sordida]